MKLTKLHETSTVRTAVYGTYKVLVYVQSVSEVNCMAQKKKMMMMMMLMMMMMMMMMM